MLQVISSLFHERPIRCDQTSALLFHAQFLLRLWRLDCHGNYVDIEARLAGFALQGLLIALLRKQLRLITTTALDHVFSAFLCNTTSTNRHGRRQHDGPALRLLLFLDVPDHIGLVSISIEWLGGP